MVRRHFGACVLLLVLTISWPANLSGGVGAQDPTRPASPQAADATQTSLMPLPLPDLKSWVVEGATVEGSDGAMTLRAGGWVRTSRPMADFKFAADVKLARLDAQAEIVVRAWPSFDSGGAPSDGSHIVVTPNANDLGGWRHVEVEAAGDTIRATVDGMAVPVKTAVPNPQGYLAFYVSRVSADFRNTRLERRATKAPQARDGAYPVGSGGVSTPKMVAEGRPNYSSEAMRRKIQGTVTLSLIVDPSGEPRDIRVMQSLDPTSGLDQNAIEAARRWRFTPGMRDGAAVPVMVTLEMSFSLR